MKTKPIYWVQTDSEIYIEEPFYSTRELAQAALEGLWRSHIASLKKHHEDWIITETKRRAEHQALVDAGLRKIQEFKPFPDFKPPTYCWYKIRETELVEDS